MSEYKVAERIALLNSSERKAFRRKLRETGNIQHLRLYDKIIKHLDDGLPLDKKKAFAKVFDEPWTTDRDYLIRNLFRLLSIEAEDFLLNQNNDPRLIMLRRIFLLRRMTEARQFADFREEFDELYLTAQAANDLEIQAELLKIYIEFISKSNHGPTNKQADTAEAFITEHELIMRLSRHRLEELALRFAASERYARDAGIGLSSSLPALAHDPGSDPVVSYFRTHADVYRLSGIAQAVKAADALSLLENINTPIISKHTHALDLTDLMASGYDDAGEHVAAAAIYEQMPAMPGFENYTREQEVFDKYTLCLLQLKKYEHTAALIKQRAENNNIGISMQLRRAMALVFDERGIEAEQLIHNLKTDENGSNYIFAQLVSICIKMQRNETNAAEDILKHLMQSRAIRKSTPPGFKEQPEIFRQALQTSLTDKTRRLSLSNEIETLLQPKLRSVQLPLIWLKQYLNTAAIIPLRKL